MRRQELFHQRHNPFVGVFNDVVSCVGQSMDLGVGKELEKSLEEVRTKAPISHAPDEHPGVIGEPRQSLFDFQ